jgi:hypothetical protein
MTPPVGSVWGASHTLSCTASCQSLRGRAASGERWRRLGRVGGLASMEFRPGGGGRHSVRGLRGRIWGPGPLGCRRGLPWRTTTAWVRPGGPLPRVCTSRARIGSPASISTWEMASMIRPCRGGAAQIVSPRASKTQGRPFSLASRPASASLDDPSASLQGCSRVGVVSFDLAARHHGDLARSPRLRDTWTLFGRGLVAGPVSAAAVGQLPYSRECHVESCADRSPLSRSEGSGW